jgi:hypothetical protein
MAGAGGPHREELKLSQAAQYLLDESRMVLPGIQAIFGFQLMSVFSERFKELGEGEQRLHYVAIALVVAAIAIVMTPAAYHRTQEANQVTDTFIVVSSRLLLAGMLPLAVALCLDLYLLGQMIFGQSLAVTLACAFFAGIFFMWGVFPRWHWLHLALARARR